MIRKIINTFLTPKFLWGYFIQDYASFFRESDENKSQLNLFWQKIVSRVWFLPTLRPAVFWRDRSVDGDRGADKYMDIDDSGHFLMDEVISRASGYNDSFLDLGCNVGRYLNYLAAKGYNRLFGVDVSKSALEAMTSVFPLAFKNSNVKIQTMQEYLLDAKDDNFDIVYTHGATVELIPATFPLIKEVSRVCKKYVVFLISENGHLVPRFWEYEFKKHGLRMVKLHRYSLERDTLGDSVLMVFKKVK